MDKINLTQHKKASIFTGMFQKNTVFISGLALSPAVLASTTVNNATITAFVFTIVTFFSITVSSFIPRKVIFSVRIVLYALISSLIYVPTIIFAHNIFGELIFQIGYFIIVIVVNPLIISKSETRFLKQAKSEMLVDLIGYIIGFDIAIITIAFIREILGSGSIGGKLLGIDIIFPILKAPCGALILIAFLGAFLKKIYITYLKVKNNKNS